ncbi:GNAT family N-acetyltransferase [Paenibacillus senegalensis]|uniref:GNAT family N-acetyltransferase n=1 Tax=Paenibacillus senegalensis TaxID=1465766 RepID=UPI000289EF75|nr:GNAT family N-acetyltransferase [Paenibacillus senegalensis]
MIIELAKPDYYKIKHIADSCKNIEVLAVANGNNPGRIYVDECDEPSAALVWIEGQQGFQIVGDPQSQPFLLSLEGYMRDHIEPYLKKQDIKHVEIGAEMDTWKKSLSYIFKNRRLSSDIQHVFCLETLQSIEPSDDGMTIKKLDADVLKSRRLKNHSFLEKKLLRFWDSADSFLYNGFGFYAEVNHYLVSVCFSSFVAEQMHAIDIETAEGFRKRGYGTAVAKSFVQECIQKGIQPYWDCAPDNAGSIQLAKAIGLSPKFDYQVFWFALE